jgi:hypothetical protein
MPDGVCDLGVGAWCWFLHVALHAQEMHFLPAVLHSHPWLLPSPLAKMGLVHVEVLQHVQQGLRRRRWRRSKAAAVSTAAACVGLLVVIVPWCCCCLAEILSRHVAWLPGPTCRREFFSVLGSTRLPPLRLPPLFSARFAITRVMLIKSCQINRQ